MERESRDASAGRPTGGHGGAAEEPESRSPSSRRLWKFLMRQPCLQTAAPLTLGPKCAILLLLTFWGYYALKQKAR